MRSLELVGHVRRGFAQHLDPTLSGRLRHGNVFQGVQVGRVGQRQLAHLAHVEQAVATATARPDLRVVPPPLHRRNPTKPDPWCGSPADTSVQAHGPLSAAQRTGR